MAGALSQARYSVCRCMRCSWNATEMDGQTVDDDATDAADYDDDVVVVDNMIMSWVLCVCITRKWSITLRICFKLK